jgi:hypothetical protein
MGAKGIVPGTTTPYSIDTSTNQHGGYATNGILIRDKSIGSRKIGDGLSKTLLMGEMSWDVGEYEPWMGGLSPYWQNSMTIKNVAHPLNYYKYDVALNQLSINDASFGSDHAGRGAHFVMGDASVQFLSEDIELNTLKGLASRAQAEVAPESVF